MKAGRSWGNLDMSAAYKHDQSGRIPPSYQPWAVHMGKIFQRGQGFFPLPGMCKNCRNNPNGLEFKAATLSRERAWALK